jgi:hypothetical protein
MLTGHSLGFFINKRTTKNSTVYQAHSTYNTHNKQINMMHNIVSSKQTKIKQQHCKLVDINNRTDFNEEQHIITHSKQIMKQHRNENFSSIKKIKDGDKAGTYGSLSRVTFSSTDLLCFSTNRNNGDLTQK